MDMISGLRYEAARRKKEAEAKEKAEADAKIETTEPEPAAGMGAKHDARESWREHST